MILLQKEDYLKAQSILFSLPINSLFAQSIIDNKVNGKIFVNEIEHCSTFLFVHPYGLSLLIGEEKNEKFNDELKEYCLNVNNTRVNTEWLQAYPRSWNNILPQLFGDKLITEAENIEKSFSNKIELSTRVNFKFNREKYAYFKSTFESKPYHVVRTSKQHFTQINGTVVPKHFWNNEDDFYENGIGFSLMINGRVASTAFSAFIIGTKLELAIETIPECRGKELAIYTCSSLIEYCLENHFEPVWACRLENENSYKLALKLGFEPSVQLPFYKLIKNEI